MKKKSIILVQDLGKIDFDTAWEYQERLVSRKWREEIEDYLLLMEHPSVFTLGRSGQKTEILYQTDGEGKKIPVYEINRGGRVTYHGPGQLVGYPILDLTRYGRDIHYYIRQLEEVLINTVGSFGITAHRRSGLTGVWVGERKIASIGVGVRRWITIHGFAFNVNPDLSFFKMIIPCGLSDIEVTSLKESGVAVSMPEVKEVVKKCFSEVWRVNCEWVGSGVPSAETFCR